MFRLYEYGKLVKEYTEEEIERMKSTYYVVL